MVVRRSTAFLAARAECLKEVRNVLAKVVFCSFFVQLLSAVLGYCRPPPFPLWISTVLFRM